MHRGGDTDGDDEQQEALLGSLGIPHQPVWRRYLGKVQRRRVFCVVVALVLLLPIVGLLLSVPSSSSSPKDDTVCLDRDCVITAGHILENMNFAVDPCEDFYEYSCGGWIKEHPIPEDKSQVGSFNTIIERNLRILQDVLENPYSPDDSLSPDEKEADEANFRKIQLFYGSCMNETRINNNGHRPLLDLLREGAKHFPLGEKKTDLDKVALALVQAHSSGTAALFEMGVSLDDKDPEHNVLLLQQGGLSLPSREYYQEVDYTSILEITAEKAFKALLNQVTWGTGRDYRSLAKSVVELEGKLAKFTWPSADLGDPLKTYNPFTLTSLQKLSSAMPWETYFQNIFPKEEFPNVIHKDTKIIVGTPDFFGNLTDVLSGTTSETLEAYILWNYINAFSSQASDDIKEIFREFEIKIGRRANQQPPRWRTCLSQTDSFLGDLLGRPFVVRAFPGTSKKAATSAIKNIKDAFLRKLPSIDWLDEVTRQKAVEKVHSLNEKVGYADEVMEPKTLDAKYKDAAVDQKEYFTNVVGLTRWQSKDNLRNILKPIDRTKWEMTPPTVNAYYHPTMNELVFPAGILQTPFYSALNPQYLNFGAIGAVVGHELTHAFDNLGRQYDSHGRLNDWWSNSTSENFSEKAKCFVKQYSKYSVIDDQGKSHNLDGKLTLGENLADNGGLSRALEAWRRDMHAPEGAKKNFMLPGFPKMTKDQLFFLSFAQVWCGNSRPEIALRRLRTDPHSPGRYRVIGAVTNSKEFSDTFKCPAGSPMNPKDKCLIW
ncbi:hypothetical protein DFS34DRAFT_649068 [Phlyctochytrium arcticum]|nr:hypothetical protein DFS34DRAFT_649068 [Phlyctochytrium arcticum]